MSRAQEVELAQLVLKLPWMYRFGISISEEGAAAMKAFGAAKKMAEEILEEAYGNWFDMKLNYPEILTRKMKEFTERMP